MRPRAHSAQFVVFSGFPAGANIVGIAELCQDVALEGSGGVIPDRELATPRPGVAAPNRGVTTPDPGVAIPD